MKFKKIFVMIIVLSVLIFSGCSNSNDNNDKGNGNDVSINISDNEDKVVVYFFWGDGCPHCEEQKPFLEELESKYPEVEVKSFETWKNPENAKLFQEVAKAYDTTARGVPATFIGDEFWVGFADYMGEEMEQKVLYCIENDCVNPGDKLSIN